MGHVPSHAVASFLRVSDHTIERISHESWSLDPGRTHVRRRRVGTAPQERPDWKLFFSDQAVDGTIVIADERSGEMLAYDVERAQKRFMPVSTFKVPHALFALDAGAVRDEFQVIRWDGVNGL